MDGTRFVESAYAEREAAVRSFFTSEAPRLAELCHQMATRFARGGKLIAFGAGSAATDAQHISVEFVHPVIVGKRALAALALVNDIASVTGAALRDPVGTFGSQIRILGSSQDIGVGIVHSGGDPGSDAVMVAAQQAVGLNMVSVLLTGPSGSEPQADYVFRVGSDDPYIVQEVHETAYHVLWELVHVFFEHKGLLEDRIKGPSHDTGGSSFLYPFLSESEADLPSVLSDVRGSIAQKAEDIISMRAGSCDPQGLIGTADLIADRLQAGGKVLVAGNGGSATDAQDFVADLLTPQPGGEPIPAVSLTNDVAVVTGVGNDVGFENVFARQIMAHGNPQDVLVAISTSGGSRNLLAAAEEARRRGLLTVALAGYGGGALAELCDRAHVIHADYIPRIQEAQATQYHVIRQLLNSA